MTAGPKHFLILDDEESIRQSVAAYMEDNGYVVFMAGSGEEALEIVKTWPIDEVIVDIRLPGMNGNLFMTEAGKIRPHMKFLVHTGSADYRPPVEVKALGVTSERIFIKPVTDIKVLYDALKRE